MSDVYHHLAHHLDRLPGGFPSTDSGVEIKILKKLFTKEQAQIAVALTLRPEPAETISGRLNGETDKLVQKLDEMAYNGLILRIKRERTLYMAAQFVIGIWEYHVNRLDSELINYFNEYLPHLTKPWSTQKTHQLRVIPISKSLDAKTKILPYEIAEQIIQSHSKIVVAPCICRKEHGIVGKGCNNPLEVCLVFGFVASYYERNGLGRPIDKDEALAILLEGINAGLVLQPGNAKKSMNLCMCCGCCCQILKNLSALPNPAEHIHSNYYAVVRPSKCVTCGTCADRCHMEAITIDNHQARIDLDRCIGCGVCIPSCETKALCLAEKHEQERHETPETLSRTYRKILRERGLI